MTADKYGNCIMCLKKEDFCFDLMAILCVHSSPTLYVVKYNTGDGVYLKLDASRLDQLDDSFYFSEKPFYTTYILENKHCK